MGKDKHKDGETAATSETNPQDGCQDAWRDHSQDQEARDAALAQTIAEAVTREMAKAHAHYQAILNERGAATLPTSQARNVQPRMQSARSATKLDISIRYANPRKEAGESILPREHLIQNRTLTSMKMESDNPIHLW